PATTGGLAGSVGTVATRTGPRTTTAATCRRATTASHPTTRGATTGHTALRHTTTGGRRAVGSATTTSRARSACSGALGTTTATIRPDTSTAVGSEHRPGTRPGRGRTAARPSPATAR